MEVSALQKVNVHSTEKSFFASVKPDMFQTSGTNVKVSFIEKQANNNSKQEINQTTTTLW